jgi:hypothetical protein
VGAAAPVGAMKHGPAGRQTACWKTFADGGKAVPPPFSHAGPQDPPVRRRILWPEAPGLKPLGIEIVHHPAHRLNGSTHPHQP